MAASQIRQWIQHPTELADLAGRRLVIADETEKNQRLRIGLVKQATGNKPLKARFMRKDFFTFERQFKLVLVTNNRPVIEEQTDAVWRRAKLVPFRNVVPVEIENKRLGEELWAESSGVLNWLIDGCRKWQEQRKGLVYPSEVIAATEDYRHESAWLERFVEECLDFVPGISTLSSLLLQTFEAWCHENGIAEPNPRDLWPLLERVGCTRVYSNRARAWNGVTIQK